MTVIKETSEIIVNDGDTSITIQTVPDDALPGTFIADHGSMTGLSDDDHPQYLKTTDTLFTNAEIKTAYENNADTNAFTDSASSKLTNIEANATADQTKAEIEALLAGSFVTPESLKTTTTLTVDGNISVSNIAVFIDASSNDVTGTLPTAVGNTGSTVHIKRVDTSSNVATVETNGAETIDTFTGIILAIAESKLLISDGTNWRIL